MAATTGKDGKAGVLMTAAELKPLLHLAKRRPVNCAIAMDKNKQGIILLHRRTKAKKLLAELKRQAKAAGIELDTTSPRFGRVSVDGASDAGMATFTVNKSTPGPMRRAMLEQVRPAGLQRCEVVVDESLENETEEDDADEDTARTGPASEPADLEGSADPPRLANRQAQHGTGPDAQAGTSPAGMPAHGPAMPPSPEATPDVAGFGGQRPAGPGAAIPADPVRTRLASLGLCAKDALTSGSPQADGIRAAAVRARGALASGDMALAGQSADAMERLLGTGLSSPAARPGAQERPGNAMTDDGPAPSPRPDRAAALKAGLLSLAQRIAGADPADRRKLVSLGSTAQAALAAGDLATAAEGIKALRQALPARGGAGTGRAGAGRANTHIAGPPPAEPPATGAVPADSSQDGEPGFAAAALRAGFDRAATEAPDRSGWVNVAAAAPSMFAPPGNRTATDAPSPGTLPQFAPRQPWDDLQPSPARVGLCAPEAELRATPDDEPRQGREASLLDRFRLNGRHAHTQTLLGAGVEAARLSSLPERDGGAGGQVGPGPRDRELRRVRWEQQDYDGMQSWRDDPYPILAGPAALLGTLVGGAATPESLVGGPAARGVARSGVPLLRTMLQGGARQAVVQSGANVGAQELNMADGLQDRFNPVSTLQQAGVGAIVGAGAPGVSAALRPAQAAGPRVLSVARGTPAMEPLAPPAPAPVAPLASALPVYGTTVGSVPASAITGTARLSGRPNALSKPATATPLATPASPVAPRLSTATGKVMSAADRLAIIDAAKKKSLFRADLNDHFFDANGKLIWPADDGATAGWHPDVLKQDMIVDRYGPPSGTYLSPEGVSYEARALPYDKAKSEYHRYRVLKDLPVKVSKVASSFDQIGGGIQYKLEDRVASLLNKFLEEL